MARPLFPNDVTRYSEQKMRRLTKREVPTLNLEPLMGSTTLELPINFEAIMRDVAEVHPRAVSWVNSRLNDMTDVELAAEWGLTPQAVTRWRYAYELKIKAVFAKHFTTKVDLSTDHLCKTAKSLFKAA